LKENFPKKWGGGNGQWSKKVPERKYNKTHRWETGETNPPKSFTKKKVEMQKGRKNHTMKKNEFRHISTEVRGRDKTTF